MHPAAALLAIQLLYPKQFHADETNAKSGEQWMALIGRGDQTTLRNVTIHVNRVDDVDDNPGQKSGKEVSIKTPVPETDVIILLRGLTTELGSVPTAHFRGAGDAGKPLQITLPNATYKLAIDCKGERCPMTLSTGETSQRLFVFKPDPEAGDFKGLRVIWAGDLDRDGKLDLIIDETNHYNGSDTTLYLSSKAKKGELVGLAAKLETVGC